jgi:hypothetical protein
MDAVSIIIGLILVGIFLLIFILPAMNTKRREKKMLLTLSKLVEKQKSKIDQKEMIGDVMIGLDQLKGILYFYKHRKDQDIYDILQLRDVSCCKLLIQKKQMKSNNENFNPYEKLGLEFILNDKSKPNIIWLFYQVDEYLRLNLDLKQLEKWEKSIQDIISKQSISK